MTADTDNLPIHLTREKAAPSLCYLVRQFAATDVRELCRKAGATITGRRPPYVGTAEYAPPDSHACRKAMALVKEVSPDFLFGHCVRTHAFGVAMASMVRLGFLKKMRTTPLFGDCD